jgi:biotin carboxyl carrier protein
MIEVLVTQESQAFNVQIAGQSYEVETVRHRGRGRSDEGDTFIDGRWLLRAPLTGVVVETRVSPGDVVAQGDVLVVVEAMKMLNELRARVAGTISAVNPQAGQRVEIGGVLVEISEAI